MKVACVSHQSHTKATSSRGAVASPRLQPLPPPDYRCSSVPSPLAPAPDTFEQLQTRVERVSGARDDIVTTLGRMGKGSFDERRSMRKRIYDKERVVKAGDRGVWHVWWENVVGWKRNYCSRMRQGTIYSIW